MSPLVHMFSILPLFPLCNAARVRQSSVLKNNVLAHGNAAAPTQTNAETVTKYCDVEAVAKRRMLLDGDAEGNADIQSKVLESMVHELENNNLDKMAKDAFTFYACVRWVPDDKFLSVALEEMRAGTLNATNASDPERRHVAEAYQKMQFVPLLCSENFGVYWQKSKEDNTYFGFFKKMTLGFAKWLDLFHDNEVLKSLADVDRSYCPSRVKVLTGEDKSMKSTWCEITTKPWARWALAGDSGSSEDRWEEMAKRSKKIADKKPGGGSITLDVHVVKGGYFQKVNTFGSTDPFVVLKFGSAKAATEKVEGHEPVWNETLSLEATSADSLFIEVYDADFFGPGDLLATGTISPTDFPVLTGHKVGLPVVSSPMKPFTVTLANTDKHEAKKTKKNRKKASTLKVEVTVRDRSVEWNQHLAAWHKLFPFPSFLASDTQESKTAPHPEDRILVCFGKRVASEPHRRPDGGNILTDMNNIGCHGFWDTKRASLMMKHMVELWKPPTCQLSEMQYHMKHELVRMVSTMNKKLFDALPSLLLDEEFGKDEDAHSNQRAIRVGDRVFFEGNRVKKASNSNVRGTIVFDDRAKHLMVMWDDAAQKEDAKPQAVDVQDIRVIVGDEDLSWFQRFTKGMWGAMSGMREIASSVSQWVDKELTHADKKMTSLGKLMSSSTAKWVVCPIKSDLNAEDQIDLDASLATEDVAFQEWVKEAYGQWTGHQKAVPGAECQPESFLDQGRFPQCKVCKITEMWADHTEKYEQEKFVCPAKPMLEPNEQLEILRQKHEGQCLLRMSDRHMSVADWHYNGRWPSRKQFDAKANAPDDDYELVKLLKIGEKDAAKQVELGRQCTVQERRDYPRFCLRPAVHNQFSSISEWGNFVGNAVGGAAVGSLGAISSLGTSIKSLTKNETNLTNNVKSVGENLESWIKGIGRSISEGTKQAAGSAVKMFDGTGDARRKFLKSRLLQTAPAAELLHSLSFQHPRGSSGRTSNSHVRYDRYVVTCPCDGFDPVTELALRTQWGEVALRMLRESHKQRPALFDAPSLQIHLRGEAHLFQRKQKYTRTNESSYFQYETAIAATSITPQQGLSTVNWWTPADKALSSVVGGVGWDSVKFGLANAMTSQAKLDKLKGLQATVWCGPKSSFGSHGGSISSRTVEEVYRERIANAYRDKKEPGKLGALVDEIMQRGKGKEHVVYTRICEKFGLVPEPEFRGGSSPSSLGPEGPAATRPLKQCIRDGVAGNDQLRRYYQHKSFLQNEVVVVVQFSETPHRECDTTPQAVPDASSVLCGGLMGTRRASGLHRRGKTNQDYQGIHTGAGWPKGTLEEVVLRPEDLAKEFGWRVQML